MNGCKRETPQRIRRFQIMSLGLLVVCGTINYLDRGALSVANPAIRADLGVSIGEMGLLLSAFAWSYALAQLPVGGLVDRAGPRLVLGLGMTLWSLYGARMGSCQSCGLIELRGHRKHVNSAAFSPGGKLVVTAAEDSTARVWNALTGGIVFDLLGHAGTVDAAAFSPDDKAVVTASADKTAKVWDVEQGVTELQGHRDQVNSVAEISLGAE